MAYIQSHSELSNNTTNQNKILIHSNENTVNDESTEYSE